MQLGPLCNLQGLKNLSIISIAVEQLFVLQACKKKNQKHPNEQLLILRESSELRRCEKSSRHTGTSKRCFVFSNPSLMFSSCINSKHHVSDYEIPGKGNAKSGDWQVIPFWKSSKTPQPDPTWYKLAQLFWLQIVLLVFMNLRCLTFISTVLCCKNEIAFTKVNVAFSKKKKYLPKKLHLAKKLHLPKPYLLLWQWWLEAYHNCEHLEMGK